MLKFLTVVMREEIVKEKKKPLSGQKTFTSRLKKKSQNDSQEYLSRTERQTSLVKLLHSPEK